MGEAASSLHTSWRHTEAAAAVIGLVNCRRRCCCHSSPAGHHCKACRAANAFTLRIHSPAYNNIAHIPQKCSVPQRQTVFTNNSLRQLQLQSFPAHDPTAVCHSRQRRRWWYKYQAVCYMCLTPVLPTNTRSPRHRTPASAPRVSSAPATYMTNIRTGFHCTRHLRRLPSLFLTHRLKSRHSLLLGSTLT